MAENWSIAFYSTARMSEARHIVAEASAEEEQKCNSGQGPPH
jgi:hypothetical protein